MFEAISQLGLPRGILNFIGVIYETVSALGSTGAVMFVVSSGVLQGCPLSGAFFAAAVDATLRHLSSIAEVTLRTRVARNNLLPSGIIAACADYIGGAFAKLRILIPLCGAA